MRTAYIETYRKGLSNWAREMYKLSPEGALDLLTTLSKLNEESQMMRMADRLLYVYRRVEKWQTN